MLSVQEVIPISYSTYLFTTAYLLMYTCDRDEILNAT
jgi:hypothetical protein